MASPSPFKFPHETLGHIFSFCDAPTLAVVGRVSLACLELSSLFLYEHVELKDKKSAELFFCASTPSSERVGTQLSLSRVRTVAVLYNPDGKEDFSLDRLSRVGRRQLKIDAFKLVFEVPDQTQSNVSTVASIGTSDGFEFGLCGTSRAVGMPFETLLNRFNPKTALFVTDPIQPNSADGPVPVILAATLLSWDRLEVAYRAGASGLSAQTLQVSHSILLGNAHNGRPKRRNHDPTIVLGYFYHADRKHEVLDCIQRRLDVQIRTSERIERLQVWTDSHIAADEVLQEAKVIAGSEARVREVVDIQVKPDGYVGWWREQKVKQHH